MNSDHYILDDAGNPVPEPDVMEWARWFESAGKKRVVEQTKIGRNGMVSTVFLGLDHSFGGNVPILYETMVFDKHGAGDDGERYATREQAIAGHNRKVALLRLKMQ